MGGVFVVDTVRRGLVVDVIAVVSVVAGRCRCDRVWNSCVGRIRISERSHRSNHGRGSC